MTGPPASYGGSLIFVSTYMPSIVMGAAAYSTTALDLSNQEVLDRIFDNNGDFKNAGENGSLWFGDYDSNKPAYYFPHGVPIIQNGTDTQPWLTQWANSGGFASVLGGKKKQYTS